MTRRRAGRGERDRDREHDLFVLPSLDEDPSPAPPGNARVAVGMVAPGDRGGGVVSPLDHLGIGLDAARRRPKHSSRARPSRSRRRR